MNGSGSRIGTHPREAPAEIGHRQRQQAEDPDCEDEAGHGEIALRDALLDEVADHDQEHQVERLERAQLAPTDEPCQDEDEEERDYCSNDNVHQGKMVTLRSAVASSVVSS